jgi:DNA-directed RNA polymerase subunit E"
MILMPAKSKPFKACRKCKSLVDKNATVCPICGSRDLTDDWEGLVIIIDPENSQIAKMLGIEKPGKYAIKVS